MLLSRDPVPIDVQDMRKNAVCYNVSENSDIVKWLWEILEESDEDYKQHFLKFMTGSQFPPMFGFKILYPNLAITVTNKGDEYLPMSSTCVNQLLLPKYSSRKILQSKLTEAIFSNSGFEMQ